MSRAILVPMDEPDVAAFGERAEELGYDGLWVSELWTRDAFVALTRTAAATEDVRLGTAIVNVYGRSPATIAQAAASLDQFAGGRVAVGLGTSTQKTIEDLHGMDFENPPRRLHETTAVTKRYLQETGRVTYDGECFEVADFPALGRDVPVYTAALGPATRRATGRTADGWLPHNVPLSRLATAFETIAEAATEVGRDPDDITTVPYIPCAVAEDPATARDAIRGHVAYYVGNGEGYRRAVGQVYDAADDVANAWRDGDREGAREAVTDEMVADLGVAGTPDQAREQLAELEAMDVVDASLVVVPNGVSQQLKNDTVDALSPENA